MSVLSPDEQLAADAIGSGDTLLTQEEVADWLSVSIEWVRFGRRKKNRYGPRCIRLSRNMIRYRRSDVVVWLDLKTEQRETGK